MKVIPWLTKLSIELQNIPETAFCLIVIPEYHFFFGIISTSWQEVVLPAEASFDLIVIFIKIDVCALISGDHIFEEIYNVWF